MSLTVSSDTHSQSDLIDKTHVFPVPSDPVTSQEGDFSLGTSPSQGSEQAPFGQRGSSLWQNSESTDFPLRFLETQHMDDVTGREEIPSGATYRAVPGVDPFYSFYEKYNLTGDDGYHIRPVFVARLGGNPTLSYAGITEAGHHVYETTLTIQGRVQRLSIHIAKAGRMGRTLTRRVYLNGVSLDSEAPLSAQTTRFRRTKSGGGSAAAHILSQNIQGTRYHYYYDPYHNDLVLLTDRQRKRLEFPTWPIHGPQRFGDRISELNVGETFAQLLGQVSLEGEITEPPIIKQAQAYRHTDDQLKNADMSGRHAVSVRDVLQDLREQHHTASGDYQPTGRYEFFGYHRSGAEVFVQRDPATDLVVKMILMFRNPRHPTQSLTTFFLDPTGQSTVFADRAFEIRNSAFTHIHQASSMRSGDEFHFRSRAVYDYENNCWYMRATGHSRLEPLDHPEALQEIARELFGYRLRARAIVPAGPSPTDPQPIPLSTVGLASTGLGRFPEAEAETETETEVSEPTSPQPVAERTSDLSQIRFTANHRALSDARMRLMLNPDEERVLHLRSIGSSVEMTVNLGRDGDQFVWGGWQLVLSETAKGSLSGPYLPALAPFPHMVRQEFINLQGQTAPWQARYSLVGAAAVYSPGTERLDADRDYLALSAGEVAADRYRFVGGVSDAGEPLRNYATYMVPRGETVTSQYGNGELYDMVVFLGDAAFVFEVVRSSGGTHRLHFPPPSLGSSVRFFGENQVETRGRGDFRLTVQDGERQVNYTRMVLNSGIERFQVVLSSHGRLRLLLGAEWNMDHFDQEMASPLGWQDDSNVTIIQDQTSEELVQDLFRRALAGEFPEASQPEPEDNGDKDTDFARGPTEPEMVPLNDARFPEAVANETMRARVLCVVPEDAPSDALHLATINFFRLRRAGTPLALRVVRTPEGELLWDVDTIAEGLGLRPDQVFFTEEGALWIEWEQSGRGYLFAITNTDGVLTAQMSRRYWSVSELNPRRDRAADELPELVPLFPEKSETTSRLTESRTWSKRRMRAETLDPFGAYTRQSVRFLPFRQGKYELCVISFEVWFDRAGQAYLDRDSVQAQNAPHGAAFKVDQNGVVVFGADRSFSNARRIFVSIDREKREVERVLLERAGRPLTELHPYEELDSLDPQRETLSAEHLPVLMQTWSSQPISNRDFLAALLVQAPVDFVEYVYRVVAEHRPQTMGDWQIVVDREMRKDSDYEAKRAKLESDFASIFVRGYAGRRWRDIQPEEVLLYQLGFAYYVHDIDPDTRQPRHPESHHEQVTDMATRSTDFVAQYRAMRQGQPLPRTQIDSRMAQRLMHEAYRRQNLRQTLRRLRR